MQKLAANLGSLTKGDRNMRGMERESQEEHLVMPIRDRHMGGEKTRCTWPKLKSGTSYHPERNFLVT